MSLGGTGQQAPQEYAKEKPLDGTRRGGAEAVYFFSCEDIVLSVQGSLDLPHQLSVLRLRSLSIRRLNTDISTTYNVFTGCQMALLQAHYSFLI